MTKHSPAYLTHAARLARPKPKVENPFVTMAGLCLLMVFACVEMAVWLALSPVARFAVSRGWLRA